MSWAEGVWQYVNSDDSCVWEERCPFRGEHACVRAFEPLRVVCGVVMAEAMGKVGR